MDDLQAQVCARLTAHEFMLEVMYANWFASLSELNARQLSRDLRNRMRNAYVASDADQAAAEDVGLQIMRDAEVLADRFLQKVERREAEIRAKQAQLGMPA